VPDVFISYSRHDETFVERLRTSLADSGKDVWVDREDIGPAVEWRREIELGIEGSDIFAFVISPDALRSEACERELAHAVAKQKRIVPLLRHEPDGLPVPDDLGSRNYVMFRTEEEYAPGFAALLAAIDDLPEWAREHTRLLERAEEWEHGGRENGALLRGEDLREAEAWLREQAAHKEPQPTPLQAEYILASRKAATRRQWIGAAAAIAGVAIVAIAIVAVLQRRDAQRDREQQERIAQSRGLASAADLQLPIDPELSILLADRAASESPTIEAERALRRALWASHVRLTIRGHRAWIGHAAFSPDGERVVTASRDGRGGLWDARTGENIAWLPHDDRVSWAEFSPSGDLVATASRDGTARIWDGATGEPRSRLTAHTDGVSRVAFSPDGRRVVTAGEDATARIWNPSTGEQLAVLRGHREWVTSAVYTDDGRRIVTGSDDETVRVWDATSGRLETVMPAPSGPVSAVAVDPSGAQVAIGGGRNVDAGFAVVRDLRSGDPIQRLAIPGGVPVAAAYSDDGRRLAVGSLDGIVTVWNPATGKRLAALTGHTGPITDISFNAQGTRLLTASGDTTAKIWDLNANRLAEDFLGHRGWVSTAAFAPDERTVLTASQDGTARIWDAAPGRPAEEFDAGLMPSSAAFVAEGKFVLTAGPGLLQLWGVQARAPDAILSVPAAINDADLSPDGTLILTANQDGAAQLWNRAGKLVRTLQGDQPLYSARFSPDQKTVLTTGDKGEARLWDLATGEPRSLEGGRGSVWGGEFTPDGTRVVTAGGSGETARVWDVASGDRLRVLVGHSNVVKSVDVGPDGELAVTGSADNTARIWDLDTGRTLVVLKGHGDTVSAVAFSPDGRYVLTGSYDGTARVWDVATGEQVLELRNAGVPTDPTDPEPVTIADLRRRLGQALENHDLVGRRKVLRQVSRRPELTDVGFDPTGRRFVTVGIDGTARIYDCSICGSLEELRAAVPSHVTRELTAAEREDFLGQ
jgi:WD40 repeat protein